VVGVTSTGTEFLAYFMKAERYHTCMHAHTYTHKHTQSMVNVTSLLSSKEGKQSKMRRNVSKYK